jgi:hypothetical protein
MDRQRQRLCYAKRVYLVPLRIGWAGYALTGDGLRVLWPDAGEEDYLPCQRVAAARNDEDDPQYCFWGSVAEITAGLRTVNPDLKVRALRGWAPEDENGDADE